MTRTCDLCSAPHLARGLCSMHYQRWRTYGDPTLGGHRSLPTIVGGRVPLASDRGVAIVDPEDVHLVAGHLWCIVGDGYVGRTEDGRTVLMHRVIRPDIVGEIDHINRNTLDNRRANLRPATRTIQSINKGDVRRSNPYRGVTMRASGRWRAQIKVDGRIRVIGTFDTPEEAAVAYDEAALVHHGVGVAVTNSMLFEEMLEQVDHEYEPPMDADEHWYAMNDGWVE